MEAEGHGTRPGGLDSFATVAPRRHGARPQPRSYDYQFPRKKLLGALRSALAAKLADGKLTVVESFELDKINSRQFRRTLNGLDASKTTLLVESNKVENRNLELSSRNLAKVELVRGNQVHPYHLLRFDRAIFTLPALETLQATLKSSAPRRRSPEEEA